MESSDKPISFETLRVHYCTGRSYLIKGEGRNKIYGYRHGVMTDLGDLEKSEWISLMKELIEQHGEQVLQEHLRQWCQERFPRFHRKDELEQEALELHAARIFDDPEWVSYIPFNRRYRPEVLETARLVWIRTECCQTPSQVTMEQLDMVDHRDGRIACPVCGRWSQFRRYVKEDAT